MTTEQQVAVVPASQVADVPLGQRPGGARTVMFYHRETGLFSPIRLMISDSAMLDANTPPDHIAIDGHEHDENSQRVDVSTGKVVDYQPPAPSDAHEWNGVTRRWQLNAATTAKQAAQILAREQIAIIEASGVRAARELALGQPGALDRLKAIDAAIAALRTDLAPPAAALTP